MMNKNTHASILKQFGSPALAIVPLEHTISSAPVSASADAEEQHPARQWESFRGQR